MKMINKKKDMFNFSLGNLRTKIMVMILACWMIPVITLGISNTVLYDMSYRGKIDNSVINELTYAGMLTAEKLESATAQLANINADGELEAYYNNYKKEISTRSEFSKNIRYYFISKFPTSGQFDMTDVILSENTEYHYYISGESLQNWFDYRTRIYPVLLEQSASSDSKSSVYVEGSEIYLLRRVNLGQSGGFQTQGEYMLIILKMKETSVFQYLLEDRFWNSDIVFSVNSKQGQLNDSLLDNVTVETLDQLAKSPVGTIVRRQDDVITGGMVRGDRIEFKYAAVVKNNVIYAENTAFLYILCAIFIILIPVLVFVTYYMYTKLNRPITALVNGTRKIRLGEFGAQIEYKSNDEFGYLIGSFNSMSEKLRELFDRSFKEEMALRDAKILALQAQINPHFLNNTLELMNWKARMHRDDTLSKMIESLSIMLDASMNRSKQRTIELSEELDSIDAYLYIVKMRFGKRITVEMDIDPDMLEAQIPPLIMQPLVENAVAHGIEPAFSGTVWIRVFQKGEELHIEVENDGKELSNEDFSKIKQFLDSTKMAEVNEFGQENKQYRLGIRNVDERIRLIFGEQYGLSIEKLQNRHTLNTIVMPIWRKEQK